MEDIKENSESLTNIKNSIDQLNDRAGLEKVDIGGGKKILAPSDTLSTDSLKKFIDFSKKMQSDSALMGVKTSTPEFANLFNFYINNVLEKSKNDRLARYDQMDYIVENDPALSLAKRVLRDEIIQSDVFDKPIGVTAKNLKFRLAIEKLFKSLGVKQLIPSTSENLITYGDGFWLLDVHGDQGVQKIIPIEPKDVVHRFEFSIEEIKSQKVNLKKRFNGMQVLIDLASRVDTKAGRFNRVLLGFQILNTIFPYWQVLHFRQFTTKKNIFPFGKSTFYECQSEARMYLNSKVIVSMIRSSAFIREHIKVKTSENMDPSEQWALVQQVRQMMDLFLSMSSKTQKDVPSFGDKLYYPDGLLSVEQSEGGFNFRDKFEDLNIMREDVFNSTGMPKGYFVGDSSQYVPVKSLMLQDKKTARMVYSLQEQVIAQLVRLVEVHFTFTGEFDPYTEEYAISLPYPTPDMDATVLENSTSKINYVGAIVDGLKGALGVTKIPDSIIRKMLQKYYPLSDENIESVLHQLRMDSIDASKEGVSPIGLKIGDPFLVGSPIRNPQPPMMDPNMDPNMAQSPMDPNMAQSPMDPNAPQEGDPQGETPPQPNQAENARLGEKNLYEVQYENAIKNKSEDQAMEEAFCDTIFKIGSDSFVYTDRHFVTNEYTSPDRNNQGILSLNTNDERHKKAIMESSSSKVKMPKKVQGIDEQVDSTTDRRYLNKDEKKVL